MDQDQDVQSLKTLTPHSSPMHLRIPTGGAQCNCKEHYRHLNIAKMGMASFTQLVKVRGCNLVLALPEDVTICRQHFQHLHAIATFSIKIPRTPSIVRKKPHLDQTKLNDLLPLTIDGILGKYSTWCLTLQVRRTLFHKLCE